MMKPETYTGYDKDNKNIGSRTGENANNYIDPNQVQAAIENVNKVVEEEMKKVSTSLKGIIDDANEAVIVQGTKMGPTIESLCGTIDSIPGSISGNISQMYEAAVNAHDKIQQQLNDQAKDEVASMAGFDHFG